MTTKPTCLIVGAGAGNGAAIARRFGAGGFRVLLASRRLAEMEKLAGSLRTDGIEASGLAIDAADPAGVAAAIAAPGAIDVLVYNAAGVTMATPSALSIDRFAADLNVSVISALAAAQAAAPGMAKAGRGTILLTGGGFALHPMAGMASLGVGKAAIRNLAFSLAEEFSPKGIRVGTVTIMGMVEPGTAFAPERIAEAFWRLHEDREMKLGVELQFMGT